MNYDEQLIGFGPFLVFSALDVRRRATAVLSRDARASPALSVSRTSRRKNPVHAVTPEGPNEINGMRPQDTRRLRGHFCGGPPYA